MNRKKTALIVSILGFVMLAVGLAFLLIRLLGKPDTRDAEYLVEIGQWAEQDEDGVIWNFTEIGKGKLTTNNHKNDYDFIWAIEGETLKIETKWLYDLNNDYTYKLDQGEKKLTLTAGDNEYVFLADVNLDTTGSVDAEVTEDN
ncbi:hypothetical protein IKD57_02230 [Candidatus Saccharibacteria bacterium]|nr:hypothetical protein [Candidatus Saccharibacteria bacterium]